MNNQVYINQFCLNIRTLRLTAGLSRKEMANKLGVSLHTLSTIEKGILPPRLSWQILLRIQESFRITPDKIFLPLKTGVREEAYTR